MKTLKDKKQWKPIAYAYREEDVKDAVLKYLEYDDDLMKKMGKTMTIEEFNNKWHHGKWNRTWRDVYKDIFGNFEE